jgi:hypothetical protein
MKKLIVVAICILVIIATITYGRKTKEIETESGVMCVILYGTYTDAISCNWDKYNFDTKYGEFPYAKEESEE